MCVCASSSLGTHTCVASCLAGPSTEGLHHSVHVVLFLALHFDAVVLCCR